MKPMTPTQLVELLPADPATADAALRQFEALTPLGFREPGQMRRLVEEGFTIPTVIAVRDVPSYLLTYHLTPDGGLFIDVAQTLKGSEATFADWAVGVNQLAAREGSRYIRFTTKRRGLAAISQPYGFTPISVVMGKEAAC